MGTSAALRVRRAVLATATAFVVVLAACGATGQDPGSEGAPTTPSTTSSITDAGVAVERRPAEDTSTDVSASRIWLDERIIFYAAPMVVVGTVREVAGPFWNSADGQKWTDQPRASDSPARTLPTLYREIAIDIERVVRDDYRQLGETVNLVAVGGGAGSDDTDAFGGGRFVEGERVVLFLATQVLYSRDDMVPVIMPFWAFQSVYHVGADGLVIPDGAAEAIEARRNVVVSPGDPEPPSVQENFVMLNDFVAMVGDARSTRNEVWDAYRTTPADIDARIAIMKQILETGVIPEQPGKGVSE